MTIRLISKLSSTSLSSLRSKSSSNNVAVVPQTDLDASSVSSSSTFPNLFQPSPHVYDKKVSFRLKETLLPFKGGYCIKRLDTDEDLFTVKEKRFSLSDQKTISDSCNELYKLTHAKVSLRDRMTILDCSNEPLLTLRKKSVIPGLGACTLLAFPGEDDKQKPVFEIKGNLLNKDFLISRLLDDGEECVATVRRKVLDVGSLLIGKDCYFVDVEAGMDCALVLLFVVAVDEVFRDNAGVITGGGVRGLL